MHARHRRSPFAITLTLTLALAGLAACAPTESDEGQTDDELTTQEVLDNLGAETVEQELADFPASTNKDDVRTWSMFYVHTKDGFDGILTMGIDGAGQVRHLVIADGADAQRRVVMLRAIPDAESTAAESPSFQRGTFGGGLDEATTRWVQSELVRMHDALAAELGGNGIATRSGTSDGVKCGLRIATWLAANVGGAFLGPVGYVAASAGEEALWAYIDASGSASDRATAAGSAGASSAASNAGFSGVVTALRAATRSSNRILVGVGRAGLGVGGAAMVGLVVLTATRDDGGPWPYRFLPESCRTAFTH